MGDKLKVFSTDTGTPCMKELQQPGHVRMVMDSLGRRSAVPYRNVMRLRVVSDGYFIIDALRAGGEMTVRILEIQNVKVVEVHGRWRATATFTEINVLSSDRWRSPLPPKFRAAVTSALAIESLLSARD
jgi:hypothetical protein